MAVCWWCVMERYGCLVVVVVCDGEVWLLVEMCDREVWLVDGDV